MHFCYFSCQRCRWHYAVWDIAEIHLFWEELIIRQASAEDFDPYEFIVMVDSQRGYPADIFYEGRFLARHIDPMHLWVPEWQFTLAKDWYDRERITITLGVAMPE